MFKDLIVKWIKEIHKKKEDMMTGAFDADVWDLLTKKEQEFESDLVKIMAEEKTQEIEDTPDTPGQIEQLRPVLGKGIVPAEIMTQPELILGKNNEFGGLE